VRSGRGCYTAAPRVDPMPYADLAALDAGSLALRLRAASMRRTPASGEHGVSAR
jgi:hypothetical protein